MAEGALNHSTMPVIFHCHGQRNVSRTSTTTSRNIRDFGNADATSAAVSTFVVFSEKKNGLQNRFSLHFLTFLKQWSRPLLWLGNSASQVFLEGYKS